MHICSPQLTPKHKKITFMCLLCNINALGVLDSFLCCSVEARLLGKPRKHPHTTLKIIIIKKKKKKKGKKKQDQKDQKAE